MTTGEHLDLDLRRALQGQAERAELRPSVLRSEFFRDYSIRRILNDPDQAWFDLMHTRGVGGKSTKAVAAIVAQELERCFAKDWARAREVLTTTTDAVRAKEWPVANLVRFMQVWGPERLA